MTAGAWFRILSVLVAFAGAIIWLGRHWNATGPTDLWQERGDGDTSVGMARATSRPRQHTSDPVVAIGYWGRGWNPGLPVLTQFVDPSWDPDERDMVITFLTEGDAVGWLSTPAMVCSACGQTTGPGDRTDGTYIWPEGLPHALAEHQVRLPSIFVLHVRTALAERARYPDRDVWLLDQHGTRPTDDSWWSSVEGP